MSDDKKRVLPEQLKILIEEIEADSKLISSRGFSNNWKIFLNKKWALIADKMNAVEHGARKSVPKWQQFMRDWKSNTKKKAERAKSNTSELSDVEARLLGFVSKEVRSDSIDIRSINEVDPLGEWETDTETTTAQVTEYSKDNESNASDNGRAHLKRKRVELNGCQNSDVSKEQKTALNCRVSNMEAAVNDFAEKQNRTLKDLNSIFERIATATERQASAAERLADVAEHKAKVAERQARAAEQQAELLIKLTSILEQTSNKDSLQ